MVARGSADDFARVRPAFRGTGLYAACKKSRLPLGATHALLGSCKSLLSESELRRRRRLFETGIGEPEMVMPLEKGFVRVPAPGFAGASAAVSRCREIFDFYQTGETRDAFLTNRRKPFLLRLLSGTAFAAHAEIVRLVTDRGLIDTAAHYLGSVPLLATVELWWSPPNDTLKSSQVIHVDFEDRHQVKLFLNVCDVDADQGPLTFYPRDVSQRLRGGLSASRTRFGDAQFSTAREPPICLTGPAGSGALVDTSGCLHYGSRGNRRDRVVLMVQYLRFDAPCANFDAIWTLPFGAHLGSVRLSSFDPVQRAVLGYR